MAYFALSVALVAVLLPTALRPPPSQPPTSAAFDADAPPQDDQVLLTELARGTSGTAGAGTVAGEKGSVGEIALPRAPLKPRRGRCFGNPPRQVESLYAPPCVAAFVGDNGGATWRGVTKDEIRIAVTRNSDSAYEGPIRDKQSVDNAVERTYRAYQSYFNERFELYGRRLRIYITNTGARQFQDTAQTRNAVIKADTEYKVFGIVLPGGAPPAEDEAIKRGLVTFGGAHNPQVFYEKHAPLAYSFKVVADKMRLFAAEMICKQLVGKPVSFSGDPTLRGMPRKYGILAYNDVTHYGAAEMIERKLNECGAKVEDKVYFNFDDQTTSQGAAITRMRANGVTTVILATDGTSPIVFTASASQQGYFPEWVHQGTGATDANDNARNYNRTKAADGKGQWEHSIGISALEMAMPTEWKDYYTAYKSIDPEDAPDSELNFYELLQFVGAIQMAGPKLTPQTFRDGLLLRFPSRPPVPDWTIGGGYGPADHTYPDYMSFIWFDPSADDPNSDVNGAYRHVWNGKKFKNGDAPAEPIPFFKEGISLPPPPPWS